MVARIIFRIVVVMILAGQAIYSFAADESGPDLKEWLQSLKSQDLNLRPSVAFISDFGSAEPSFLSFDEVLFNKDGLFSAVDSEKIMLLFRLNARHPFFKQKSGETLKAGLSRFFKVARSDYVVVTASKGAWQLYSHQKGDLIQLATAAGPASMDATSLADWLTQICGFNGQVLDSRNDYVLVAAPASLLQKHKQALIVRDSNNLLVLPSGRREAAGLLELISSENGYGIFRVMMRAISSPEKLQAAKVLIEP